VKEMLRLTGWKLLLHKGTLLVPVGPAWLKRIGENILERTQGTILAELGIRQFYCCKKT
jgi:DNA-directed RNA polymerase subunit N (RpoN/RPB10)